MTALDGLAAPPFTARRLLLVGTGSIGVAFLPYWLEWLRTSYPELEIRTVLTSSALRFVSPTVVSAQTGSLARIDTWPDEPVTSAPHVDLAEWPDTVLVYPASFNYLARLATGLGDSPSMLALQCTPATIGLAAGVPPGGWASPAMRSHRAALQARPNVVLAPPQPGRSVSGRDDAEGSVPLPLLVAVVERHRRRDGTGPIDVRRTHGATDTTRDR